METIAVLIIWNVILTKIYTAFYIKTNQGGLMIYVFTGTATAIPSWKHQFP